MKSINIVFGDKEFEKILKVKGKKTWNDFVLSMAKEKSEKGEKKKGKSKEEKTDVSVDNTIKVFEILRNISYYTCIAKVDELTKEIQKFKSDISEGDVDSIDEIFLEYIHDISCVKEILEEVKVKKNDIKKLKKYKDVVNKVYNLMKKH